MRKALNVVKPQQTVIVSCVGTKRIMGKEEKIDNMIVLDWHMPGSFDPALYIISIGKTRFSLDLVRETGVFAVNFMAREFEEQVMFCGSNTGLKFDKYKETGLTPIDCEKIDCKYVKEAEAVLECEVIDEFETGDHVCFVGKILKFHTFGNKPRLLHLGGRDFTTTR
ncbi:flavin reductase [Candidatus Woesearchaeota archaeon]|nr:flavin reductase [Candidatus Woesearchaeota archaeon]